jgi:endonuclease-3
MREAKKKRRARAGRIIARLRELYPEAATELSHRSPFELVVATILSAQCTDVRVNQVTPALFKAYPSATELARADQDRLEDLIRTTGFFHNKAKNLLGLARALHERHGGEVPRTMDELTALPGVGRKTANVVLGNAFGLPAIAVDTHVIRLSGRLGLSGSSDPAAIELDLMALAPRSDWTFLSHGLILHGRRVCTARKPSCGSCSMKPDCLWPGKSARG